MGHRPGDGWRLVSTSIVWFRRDLRLGDNPAWAAATSTSSQVVPLFVIDPDLWDRCSPRRIEMLTGHLSSLDRDLTEMGGRLRIERGAPADVVARVARETGSDLVQANADITPFARRRDEAVASEVDLRTWGGQWVHKPGTVLNQSGGTYQVFTPFYKAWIARHVDEWPEPGGVKLSDDPGGGWPDPVPDDGTYGEGAALARLDEFTRRVDAYPEERDRPDLDSTSRLSADLKWGTLAPRTILSTVGTASKARAAFVRQLAWRDFYAHLLAKFPHTLDGALKPDYDRIVWRHDPNGFEAWTRGLTGYPIVDAGMRQLVGEGYIHNRVRMLVGSFLVKDLLIDWRLGERHLRRHLVDGDTSQNVGNWQWVAGTGADAAPYFRVFNPVLQSKKFDPRGDYIRRWVPELASLDSEHIHAPFDATPLVLAEAGIEMGTTYPWPIVDHAEARERALAAYQRALG